MKTQLHQLIRKYLRPFCIVLGFALIGVVVLLSVRAATTYISAEPETGVVDRVTVGEDSGASGGKYVQFSGAKPNIVFVLLDDMDANVMKYMTNAKALIADQGMTFNDYMFNISQCCPSRSTMFRGQYSHNTGVLSNTNGTNGGYEQFIKNGDEDSTVATWLHDAGYNTAYMGKYLNGYPTTAGLSKPPYNFTQTHIPVGWNTWFGFSGDFYDEYDYKVVSGSSDTASGGEGKIINKGHDHATDYGTDVIAARAKQYLDDQATSKSPLLLMLAPAAPHKPYIPADQDKNKFKDVNYPRSTDPASPDYNPAYNEADVSDKPALIQSLPLMTSEQDKLADEAFRQRIRSVQDVDRMIGSLVNQLKEQGKYDNTVFIVASDNAYHIGEHRLTGREDRSDGDSQLLGGKLSSYVTDIKVPFYIKGPGITPGSVNNQMISNVDLAPTFADFAGTTTPSFVDGRSFVPLAKGQDVPWRNSFLIQRWEDHDVIPFYGIYTDDYSYVSYQNGEHEVYNLKTDPFQLENQYEKAGAPKTLTDKLDARAAALNTCSGQTCRDIESQPL